jgi:glycosyltransferase A (GT-A) superfamily protein (DUF2064 family)
MANIFVLAKSPSAGQVKTRLTPAFTPEEAASLAAASLADTLHAVLSMPAERRVLLLNGEIGRWLPSGIDVITDLTGTPAERIAAAFEMFPGPSLALGMDTPQVKPAVLAPALMRNAWTKHDAWIGPSSDGGFWSLGLRTPNRKALKCVPLSTDRTMDTQHQRFVEAGLRCGFLPTLTDVDTAQDAKVVAAQAPSRSCLESRSRVR